MEEENKGPEMMDEAGNSNLDGQSSEIGDNTEINIGGDGQNIENLDYEQMSIEDILKKNKVEIYNNEDTQPLFNQVMIRNKYFKLYMAKNTTLQNCSLMVLNDVDKKKKIFGELLENLSKLDPVNSNFVLKLKGANAFPNKVYLLFDLVMINYLEKKKQYEIDNNFKFCVLFFLIELLSALHEQIIMIEDIRYSLILFDNMDELKYMIPFGKFLIL